MKQKLFYCKSCRKKVEVNSYTETIINNTKLFHSTCPICGTKIISLGGMLKKKEKDKVANRTFKDYEKEIIQRWK